MSDEMKNQEEVNAAATEAKAEKKGGVAKKSSTRAIKTVEAGPWIYVGPNDIRKQLKQKTAYLQIPEGMDEALFVSLDAYPAWVAEQKEAGK